MLIPIYIDYDDDKEHELVVVDIKSLIGYTIVDEHYGYPLVRKGLKR